MAIIKSEEDSSQINLIIHRLMQKNSDFLSGSRRVEAEDFLQTLGMVKGKEYMLAVVSLSNTIGGLAPLFQCCYTHANRADLYVKLTAQSLALSFLNASIDDERLTMLAAEMEQSAFRLMELTIKPTNRAHDHE